MIVKSLKSEYTKWNKSRNVTSEMKKREDALRDVNENLNMFDENMPAGGGADGGAGRRGEVPEGGDG